MRMKWPRLNENYLVKLIWPLVKIFSSVHDNSARPSSFYKTLEYTSILPPEISLYLLYWFFLLKTDFITSFCRHSQFYHQVKLRRKHMTDFMLWPQVDAAPIHYAVSHRLHNNKTTVIDILVRNGADVNAKNRVRKCKPICPYLEFPWLFLKLVRRIMCRQGRCRGMIERIRF